MGSRCKDTRPLELLVVNATTGASSRYFNLDRRDGIVWTTSDRHRVRARMEDEERANLAPLSAAILAKIRSAPRFVSECNIHSVASTEHWAFFEERLSVAVIVGVDTETRPIFFTTGIPKRTSVLQLAVRYAGGGIEVFILDLLALEPERYNAALGTLFRSEQIIKLGQSLLADLKELSASYPSTSCFTVANTVVEVNALSNALAGPHGRISLQKLAFFYINKTLSKSQQLSNWDQRPLSVSQLHYAASDALVLIEIFDEIMAHLSVQSMGVFEIQSVVRTMDVIPPTPPTCSICSGVFMSKMLLNLHKNECRMNEKHLSLCFSCDTLLLLDAVALDAHASTCFVFQQQS